MKKKLTLLIYLFPVLVMCQTNISKNGTISFDLGKKKQQAPDTVQQPSPYSSDDEEDAPKQKREKKQPAVKNKPEDKQEAPDYKKEGLFKALFNAGISGCQIDGDGYAGYNYLGWEAGIGAMLRFHKFMSVSMMIDFSRKGAKQQFEFNSDQQTLELYRVQLDYVTIPVSFNIHAKNFIVVNVGLAPGFLVRFNERDEMGDDITNEVVQPSPFDLEAFGGLSFIIKKHYMIGGKFSYSLLKIRGPDSFIYGTSRLAGDQFNNDITISFTYILDTIKKRKS